MNNSYAPISYSANTSYEMKLFYESLFIGATAVPLYLTMDYVFGFISNDKTRNVVSVLTSVGVLHAVYEYSGLTNWYMENSAIKMKMRPIVAVSYTGGVEYQDGYCGATSCPLQPDELDAL
jgi:hypothetical protein